MALSFICAARFSWIERLADGAAVLRKTGGEFRVVRINAALEKQWNIRRKIIKNNSLEQEINLISTKTRGGHLSWADFQSAGRAVYNFKESALAPPRWFDLSLNPMPPAQGERLYLLVQRDITEHRIQEARHAQEQKLETFSRMVGGIAHDFNNVLAIIDGYARLAARLNEVAENGGNDTIGEYLERIGTASSRGAGLARQILAFGRQRAPRRKPVDLARLVEEQIPLLLPLAGTGIRLEAEALGPLPVECAPDDINRILINLVMNARDAIELYKERKESGVVAVKIAAMARDALPFAIPAALRGRDFACLSVTDNGHGMDETVMARIFEPFFTTKAPGKGTGLGLAGTYGMVRDMGGFIDCRSSPGKGASFHILLPLTGRPVENAGNETPIAGKSTSTGRTALVVADEEDFSLMTGKALEEMGFHVIFAASGTEALHRHEEWEGRIDLLVTDIVMPGLGGDRLAMLLESQRPAMKTVFVSSLPPGAPDMPLHIRTRRPILTKPIDRDRLARAVAEVMNDEAGRPEERRQQAGAAALPYLPPPAGNPPGTAPKARQP